MPTVSGRRFAPPSRDAARRSRPPSRRHPASMPFASLRASSRHSPASARSGGRPPCGRSDGPHSNPRVSGPVPPAHRTGPDRATTHRGFNAHDAAKATGPAFLMARQPSARSSPPSGRAPALTAGCAGPRTKGGVRGPAWPDPAPSRLAIGRRHVAQSMALLPARPDTLLDPPHHRGATAQMKLRLVAGNPPATRPRAMGPAPAPRHRRAKLHPSARPHGNRPRTQISRDRRAAVPQGLIPMTPAADEDATSSPATSTVASQLWKQRSRTSIPTEDLASWKRAQQVLPYTITITLPGGSDLSTDIPYSATQPSTTTGTSLPTPLPTTSTRTSPDDPDLGPRIDSVDYVLNGHDPEPDPRRSWASPLRLLYEANRKQILPRTNESVGEDPCEPSDRGFKQEAR